MKEQGNTPMCECRICGTDTPMLGTKLCDPCWELERRITHRPDIARKILSGLQSETEALSKPVNPPGPPFALPTHDEISAYRDLFRRELDKNMHNSSGSPSTDAHHVALHAFVAERNKNARNR